jgi:hypothetical protein
LPGRGEFAERRADSFSPPATDCSVIGGMNICKYRANRRPKASGATPLARAAAERAISTQPA